MEDLKTYRQWVRDGRTIIKGSKADQYLVDDDVTEARALFRRDQTQQFGQPDTNEIEGWTKIISESEWERVKAEKRQLSKGPKVRVRPGPGGEGTEVWCGPDKALIALLKRRGYTYRPETRYWFHPNKDPEDTAAAFENGKLNGHEIRVTRMWPQPGEPVI